MPDDLNIEPNPSAVQPSAPGKGRRLSTSILVGAGLALLIVGVAAGAGASRMMRHGEAQTLLPPTAISAMADDSIVALKGTVAEIYGNKFIVQDPSGRALVETGREGEDGKLVAKDETVTVQGRFEDGFVRGSVIIHADGKTQMIGPAGGHKPHGPKGWFNRP